MTVTSRGKRGPCAPPGDGVGRGQEVAFGGIAALVGHDQVVERIIGVVGPGDEVVDGGRGQAVGRSDGLTEGLKGFQALDVTSGVNRSGETAQSPAWWQRCRARRGTLEEGSAWLSAPLTVSWLERNARSLAPSRRSRARKGTSI